MSSIDEFAIPNTILRHFDLSSTPWNEFTAPQIEDRRKKLPDGKLFFDRLLELVGLEGSSLYPPNTPAALRRLLHTIQSLELDRLKKDCFLYYLLKDYDVASTLQSRPSMDIDGQTEDEELTIVTKINGELSGKAQVFAKKRCMSQTWKRFIDGYWALDHGLWELAVSSLSDPSITTLNFVPSIIQTLSTHVSPPSKSLSLIHQFLTFAHPELTTKEENDIKLLSLASSGNLHQAFSLIRSNLKPEDENERKRLRENLYLWILGTSNSKQIQSRSLKELLHIPLSFEENQHLIEFLLHPPNKLKHQTNNKALSLLHDLITLRLIHQGQYSESLLLDKQLAGTGGNERDRQKRREMVREFISILPQAQRQALLAESSLDANDDNDKYAQSNDQEDRDMASSWVNIQPPQSNGPSYAEIASEPPSIPIPSVLPTQPPSASTFAAGQISAPSPSPVPVATPTPVQPSTTHTSLFNAAQNAPLPSSPQKPASPFSGPPRFAPGSSSTGQSQHNPSPRRVLSGSPFNLPPSSSSTSKARGSPAPALRLPNTIINDDDEDDEDGSVLGRRANNRGRGRLNRGVSQSVEPDNEKENRDQSQVTMDIDEGHNIETIDEEPSSSKPKSHTEPPRSIRKSRRVLSSTQRREHDDTASPPPTASTTGINGMPGSFSTSKQKNPAHDDKHLNSDEEMPPPPSRSTRASSNKPESSASTNNRGNGRSRMTRSVSRAVISDDEDHSERQQHKTPSKPPAKKSKLTPPPTTTRKRIPRSSLAPSELNDNNDHEQSQSVRRSTRSRTANSVQPSEQGSPTPSETGSIARSRRQSTRAGSATPRMSTRTSTRRG
ncbi:uncharacterized protein L201_004859 [Kwoniella dendrophila CBS 6074]|uniref:ELYS-like domain-containing protein n=1 Tax=Kwoniella dendrophila CBS 6074 TaxID=1295534 RepID=A0AAX4JZB6_9TREE